MYSLALLKEPLSPAAHVQKVHSIAPWQSRAARDALWWYTSSRDLYPRFSAKSFFILYILWRERVLGVRCAGAARARRPASLLKLTSCGLYSSTGPPVASAEWARCCQSREMLSAASETIASTHWHCDGRGLLLMGIQVSCGEHLASASANA